MDTKIVIEKVKMVEVVKSDVNNRKSETSRLGCWRNALLEECWGASCKWVLHNANAWTEDS